VISTVTVKGFKSLEEVTVELGLINVFIGANGAGKSNLLEAIGLLSAAAYGRVGDPELLSRGVRPGLPMLYKTSFHNYKIPQAILLSANSDDGATFAAGILNPIRDPDPEWSFKTESLRLKGAQDIARSPATRTSLDTKRGYVALKSVELDSEDPRSRFLRLLQEYAIYDPNTPTLRGLTSDTQTRTPVGLHGGRLPEAMRELGIQGKDDDLLEFIENLAEWVMAFGAVNSSSLPLSPGVPRQKVALKFRDRFMSEKRDIFSAYEASEGVLYLMFGAVLALHAKAPKLLAIDNFDHALNPRAAKSYTFKLCEWLIESHDRQFLLTSHNPMVLDGMPLQDNRVRLFAVDRLKSGQTVVNRVRVTPEILKSAEHGIPLSQQWVMGNFGGIPDNV
jgi:energy-coupling factor transporter ATP-binding protein EcfA2